MTKSQAQALMALWGIRAANTKKTVHAVAIEAGKTEAEYAAVLAAAEG